jgi:hypothetical protein
MVLHSTIILSGAEGAVEGQTPSAFASAVEGQGGVDDQEGLNKHNHYTIPQICSAN